MINDRSQNLMKEILIKQAQILRESGLVKEARELACGIESRWSNDSTDNLVPIPVRSQLLGNIRS